MIFHSGGSLVWKKAGCAKSCGVVGWRRFPCARKLVLGGVPRRTKQKQGGKDMDKTKREVSRFEWDERTAPRLIRNEELICRDCRHRSEKSGICGKYPQGKPGSVFNSQRWCGEYSPEPE